MFPKIFDTRLNRMIRFTRRMTTRHQSPIAENPMSALLRPFPAAKYAPLLPWHIAKSLHPKSPFRSSQHFVTWFHLHHDAKPVDFPIGDPRSPRQMSALVVQTTHVCLNYNSHAAFAVRPKFCQRYCARRCRCTPAFEIHQLPRPLHTKCDIACSLCETPRQH